MNLIPSEYQPEIWSVDKSDIYSSIYCVSAGLDYTRELLSQHEDNLGRSTRKNRMWAEQMENDIRAMETLLIKLRAYPNKK